MASRSVRDSGSELSQVSQVAEANSPHENSPLKIGSTWFETQILHLLG